MKPDDQNDIVDAIDARLMRFDELAKGLPFGVAVLRRWHAEGIIPAAVEEGRKIRFDKDQVLAALAARAEAKAKAKAKARDKAKKCRKGMAMIT